MVHSCTRSLGTDGTARPAGAPAPGTKLAFSPGMETVLSLLLSLVLGGVAIVLVARLVPGFRLRGGFGDAVLVGLVYGVLKALLQTALIIVTLPLVVLTLGLFILVINAFLLWLTDKLMRNFTVSSLGALLLGALLLTVIDLAFQMVLRHPAFL
jgi:putative membrane protein